MARDHPWSRPAMSSWRSPTRATRSSRATAPSSTTSSSRPATATRRSRPTANCSMAGPFQVRRSAVRATPTTGSSAPSQTRRTRRAWSRSGSFARQPEILKFLGQNFGAYPFSASGGIVDDVQGLGFALETQTRPIYSRDFFGDPIGSDNVVVHELAHQWYGDSLAVARWQHIWLNEGFATYAEWLWSEREGLGTAQENFDFLYDAIPDDDPFWTVIGRRSGRRRRVRFRHLRAGRHDAAATASGGRRPRLLQDPQALGSQQAGGNVSTDEFIRLAEKVSGSGPGRARSRRGSSPRRSPCCRSRPFARWACPASRATADARSLLQRYGGDLSKRLTD